MEDTLNQTNTTDDNILITLNNVSSFIGLYITTIISFIGIPMNFIVLIILSRKDFEHKFYDTIRVATFFDLILCVYGSITIYMNCITCDERKYNTYLMQFYQ